MRSISTEAKVGLFVLIALIVVAFMSLKVSQQGFGTEKGYLISAVFDNVAGLEKKGASVQMAGVEIGKVEGIRLKDGKALVTMRIFPDIKLPADVTAAIRTQGLLGVKYIEISSGVTSGEVLAKMGPQPYLKDGDQIRHTDRPADMDRLMNQASLAIDDIKTITSSLSRTLGSAEGEENIRRILVNFRDLSDSLNKMVVRNDDNVASLVGNLRGAAEDLKRTMASMSEVADDINKGRGTVGTLIKDRTIADNLNKTLVSLEEISKKINDGKGTIGKLVNDDETVENLNQGLTGINRYITKADQYSFLLSYRGEYLFDTGNGKSYLEMKIQPNQDKFYMLGLVSDPRGRRQETVTTVNGVSTTNVEYNKDKLLLSAQIGKRFRDVVIRGGILENTGGFGVDYYTLKDRLQLTVEAFDFGSSGRRPHLKAYGEYSLMKHIFVSAGWDDFLSKEGNSSPLVGFSIKFSDDDLKYLLTSVPLTK